MSNFAERRAASSYRAAARSSRPRATGVRPHWAAMWWLPQAPAVPECRLSPYRRSQRRPARSPLPLCRQTEHVLWRYAVCVTFLCSRENADQVRLRWTRLSTQSHPEPFGPGQVRTSRQPAPSHAPLERLSFGEHIETWYSERLVARRFGLGIPLRTSTL
jgi:hypothetical protein